MADRFNRRIIDSSLIDIEAEDDLQYWCTHFNCNEKQLWAAVSVVGYTFNKVEAFIGEFRFNG